MTSYYQATLSDRPRFAPLAGPARARVCVIGGGFAGLNTAFGLLQRGVPDVVVLEAERIGHGASGRNGGFVFAGFSLGEQALLARLGQEPARALFAGTVQAVETIRQRASAHGIECDLVESGVIWANWFRDPSVLRQRQQLLARHYGMEWEWLPRSRLRQLVHTDRYGDGLFEPDAFHFHPLKYAAGLAREAARAGVSIHERTPATALERHKGGWKVTTPAGEVLADEVVLACGGYLARLRRQVDAAVMPVATYVMVTEPLGDRMDTVMSTRAAVYDTRFAFDYYRPLPDTRLLWGGRISVRDRPPSAVRHLLRRDMLKVFPQLRDVRIDHAWSGLMSYARHQMPQLGQVEPGLWLAQAFGGHGVAPTTMAGELVASAIAHGDPGWRAFSGFGTGSAYKPADLLGAQLGYWWAGLRDAWKERLEGTERGR